MTAARIVGVTALNLKEFLPLMRDALQRNVAEVPDAANLNPPLHHLMCISAVKQPTIRASSEHCRPQANMFHAIVLIACDERDTAEILEVAALPSVVVQSTTRGLDCMLLAGTLEQWISAVIRGCQAGVTRQTRETYNKVYAEFVRLRLDGMFKVESVQQRDDTFLLLEHKR